MSTRLRMGAALTILAAASAASGQVQSRPADPPSVTAANESWYQSREPVEFAGERYFRAGAAVFFDGNTMVRSGYYHGVPVYLDATVEPYSVILVPVGRGLLQPYERLRRGDLAGTTASRTPSFPVRATAEGSSFPEAPMAPTVLPQAASAIGRSGDAERLEAGGAARFIGTAGERPVPPPAAARSQDAPMVSIVKPEGNSGVWIHYAGVKWVSAGPAVPLRAAEFRAVGRYDGFPVFMRRNEEKVIYLPTRAGLVAPYRAR